MNIIFVSVVGDLCNNASSTDIMTYNLLYGFYQIGYHVTFIALNDCETEQKRQESTKSYQHIVNEIKVLPCCIGRSRGKYSLLAKLFVQYMHRKVYKKFCKQLEIPSDAILISHSPAVDSVYFCRTLKRLKNLFYIEYWSDPIALSGIFPEQFNYKRWAHAWIERRLLKLCDRVVYGTEPLYISQKTLYPALQAKMSYVDVSYRPYDNGIGAVREKPINFVLYSGGYYSSIRNIKPLFEAVKAMNGKVHLDVYGGGDVTVNDKNISFHKRVSPIEIQKIEAAYQTIICLMNKTTLQIPGKTFYNINCKQNIIVILDGDQEGVIRRYLEKYNRYIICENTASSIITALSNLKSIDLISRQIIDNFSPQKISNDLLKFIDKR